MVNIAHIQNLRQLLEKHGLWAKKSFGQNYLVNENILLDIVEAGSVGSDDTVIEIGPGPGSLTQKLCERAKHVIALEMDRETIPVLHDSCGDFDNLEIIEVDALKYIPPKIKYKLIANIPYYITGRIITYYIATVENKPSVLVMMMQKEVTEKILSKPGDESALSLFCKAYGKCSLVTKVPPECFFPSPKVDSCVIKIEIYDQPLFTIDGELYSKALDVAFLYPRKQLHNNLSTSLHLTSEEAKKMLESIGIDPMRRAQTLTIEEVEKIGTLIQ